MFNLSTTLPFSWPSSLYKCNYRKVFHCFDWLLFVKNVIKSQKEFYINYWNKCILFRTECATYTEARDTYNYCKHK